MGELRLNLLGQVGIFLDGKPVTGFKSSKAIAVLSYVALSEQPCARSTLAGLLWGDLPEANARMNLRQVLSNLRRLIGDHLTITRRAVAFNRDSRYWLDVEALETTLNNISATIEFEQAKEAVALYRGDFLEGLVVHQALAFEEWVAQQRNWQKELVINALSHLVEHYEAAGNEEAGIYFARRLLTLEPWQERTHRKLMRLLALSGQRSAALAQYHLCRQILVEELDVEPEPETTMLYEHLSQPQSHRTSQLPRQPTPFVGRQAELKQITGLLADPHCRLLTLVGPGGVGKTRLALEIAARQQVAFLAEVYFVPLGSVSASEFLISTLADKLAFPFYQGGDPKTQLLNYLRQKTVLLVLDNFEQLVESAPLLAEILAVAPRVKLLVTSQERLHLREEWVVPIQGLPVPAFNSIRETEEQIRAYEAVQLFLQCARRANPTLTFSRPVWPAVIEICHLVEGLPLGIELAATQLGSLACVEIATEIKRNLNLLAATWRDGPEKHRSLQAVFDYSWGLLSPAQQQAFCRLSVFRGSFDSHAARQIAGVSTAYLGTFVDKSLLRLCDSGRYEMHDLLRQYSVEKLGEAPEKTESLYEQYSGYYTVFLQRRDIANSADPKQNVEEISRDIDNIRAAWHRAANGQHIHHLSQGAAGLFGFYDIRGWFREGERLFGQAVENLRESNQSSMEADETRKIVLGQLLIRQGWFRWRLGHYPNSKKVLQEGLTILQQVKRDVHQDIILALGQLGLVAWYLGDYQTAKTNLEASLAKVGQNRDWTSLIPISFLGFVNLSLGDYVAAKQYQQLALSVARQTQERRSEAIQMICLGNILNAMGDYREAYQLIQVGLALCRELNDQFGTGVGLTYLGKNVYLQGDYQAARQHYQAGSKIFEEIDDRWGLALTLTGLGAATCALGEYAICSQHLYQALKIAVSCRLMPVAIATLVELARLLVKDNPGKPERLRAAEWLALARYHPAGTQETRDQADSLLLKLVPFLPPNEMSRVQVKGQGDDLKTIAAKILRQN